MAPETPDEVVYQTAEKLVETYADCPVGYVNYGGSMKMYEYVYKLGRKALAEKGNGQGE